MRLVIQRVTSASVSIDGEIVGKIAGGLMVLVGVREGDTEADMKWLAQKTVNMRIFDDELSGTQQRNIEKVVKCSIVIDRTSLILGTLGQRAAGTRANEMPSRTMVE